jgi:hypothetical protein
MSHLDLAVVILGGFVIIGVAWGWLDKRSITPRREHLPTPVERARMDFARARNWERRLARLHIIEPEDDMYVVVRRKQ